MQTVTLDLQQETVESRQLRGSFRVVLVRRAFFFWLIDSRSSITKSPGALFCGLTAPPPQPKRTSPLPYLGKTADVNSMKFHSQQRERLQ